MSNILRTIMLIYYLFFFNVLIFPKVEKILLQMICIIFITTHILNFNDEFPTNLTFIFQYVQHNICTGFFLKYDVLKYNFLTY